MLETVQAVVSRHGGFSVPSFGFSTFEAVRGTEGLKTELGIFTL